MILATTTLTLIAPFPDGGATCFFFIIDRSMPTAKRRGPVAICGCSMTCLTETFPMLHSGMRRKGVKNGSALPSLRRDRGLVRAFAHAGMRCTEQSALRRLVVLYGAVQCGAV